MSRFPQSFPSCYWVSLGCPKNTVDTEKLVQMFALAGFRLTPDPGDADIAVVNTCGFIESALDESFSVVREMLAYKARTRISCVVVYGCAVSRNRGSWRRACPGIDGVFSLDERRGMLDFLRRRFSVGKQPARDPTGCGRGLSVTPAHYAYLKIAEGCGRRCAFCTIPKIRGPYRSRPRAELVREARRLAARGVRELILVAQDTTAWGKDLYGKSSIGTLVCDLEKIPDIRWIRLMYAYPEGLDRPLLDFWLDSSKLLPYLDLPIQHAHPEILKKMGRAGTFAAFDRVFRYLKERRPDFCLRTTLITGFPGEKADHFRFLKDYARRTGFDRLGVFPYSPERGTAAVRLPGRVRPDTARKRAAELMLEQQERHFNANRRLRGKKETVLVEGRLESGEYAARTYRDAPDIDALVLIRSRETLRAGSFVEVRFSGARGYDLEARPEKPPRQGAPCPVKKSFPKPVKISNVNFMTDPGEQLTPDEANRLAPYVSSTERSVFVVCNLPEVVKGALFSRYSRSELGLRRLLLKEFIESGESALEAMTGSEGTERREIALQKAEKFYDRVLDGYGDDSIGELGGAHLALENVSIVASKVIEDARIGGSPLEKSTRYVYFDRKADGDYRFYREPALMASPHREMYLETCRELFRTYSSLIDPMTAHVRAVVPRGEGVSENAFRASVRARVCDALRGILPASTLTNIGVFGNGRFFENLIQKMRTGECAELRDLAGAMFEELKKEIPSFVRRGCAGHRHFEARAEFERAQRGHLAEKARKWLGDPPPSPAPDTMLVEYDPEAEIKVASALLFPHADQPLGIVRERVRSLTPRDRAELFAGCAAPRTNRRHKPPRALEHAVYTFDLAGDFGIYRDLQRHRMLTQERQLLSTRHGYVIPEDIRDAGLEGPFEEAMCRARDAYRVLAADFPVEAQYVVPMAYRIRWYFRVNLRSLLWLCELRSAPQGHAHYRKIARDMASAVTEVHPAFACFFKFVSDDASGLGRLGQEIRGERKKREAGA
jgi:ribosomal protein S12 methylthiotransferase RimO